MDFTTGTAPVPGLVFAKHTRKEITAKKSAPELTIQFVMVTVIHLLVRGMVATIKGNACVRRGGEEKSVP